MANSKLRLINMNSVLSGQVKMKKGVEFTEQLHSRAILKSLRSLSPQKNSLSLSPQKNSKMESPDGKSKFVKP
jgi:hypothetical protein